MQFKLANIVLDAGDFLAGHEDLLYRSEGLPGYAHAEYLTGEGVLAFAGALDLTTYLNALPLEKWRRYAHIDNVTLHLELSGADCDVALVRVDADAHIQTMPAANMCGAGRSAELAAALPAEFPQQEALADGWFALDVPVALDDSTLVGVRLTSAGVTRVRCGYFATDVAPERIRKVRLALATTTFNNEDYILPNIDLVRTGVLGSNEPIASACHLFVVDNGRTLDAGALSGNGVTVLPNPNVGGAGGFARGMIAAFEGDAQGGVGAPKGGEESLEESAVGTLGEDTSNEGAESGAPEVGEEGVRASKACAMPGPFTHVLLMDDDVRVFPESFIRTFNLLSLVTDEYADAFLQGAMLKLQEPNKQFEDVSYAKRMGGYERYKPTLDISQIEDMVRNETLPVEGHASYGAWWYCCMPLTAVRANGLPLPLFIRIDDVEYGMRCGARYMTLGGICVWHSQFVGRFRASVDGYQYARNMLIAIACDGFADMRAFMLKYWRNFHIYLRFMAYETAELWLDALKDYLRGPGWLAKVDGAEIMKQNAQKNEKLVPVSELDPAVMSQLEINQAWLGHEELIRSALSKAAEAIPHDRHMLPDALLIDKPAFVDYSGTLSPWRETARRRTLVALDATAENGHIRTLDRKRYRRLLKRYRTLKRDFNKRGSIVALDWRCAMPHLTSVDFWKNYLGMK